METKTIAVELCYFEVDMLWSAIGREVARAETNVQKTEGRGQLHDSCKQELAALRALHAKLNELGGRFP